MGIYLNPKNTNFLEQVQTGRYVDKTMLIEEINKRVNDNDFKFVCVSRPRRFDARCLLLKRSGFS